VWIELESLNASRSVAQVKPFDSGERRSGGSWEKQQSRDMSSRCLFKGMGCELGGVTSPGLGKATPREASTWEP
jgi:hypothetical protein